MKLNNGFEVRQNALLIGDRRSLGEFYTKEEIIDEVLDVAGLNGEALRELYTRWRNGERPVILEPACGSGSFLVRVVQRAFKALGCRPDIARFLEDVLVGIDINPFAVELAKQNLINAIADGMSKCGATYVPGNIQILWADSLSTFKDSVNAVGQHTIRINIPTLAQVIGDKTIDVPLMPPLSAGELLDRAYSFVESGRSFDEFFNELVKLSKEAETRRKELEQLYEHISKIRERGNSRIIELIKNSAAVASLIGRCDFVVGNPPWVRIHRLSKQLVQNLRKHYRYFADGAVYDPKFKATKTPFKEQFDYSIAFVERGLEFLRQNGTLAYVITSKIIKTSYAGALREDLVKNYTLLEIRDYSLYPKELFRGVSNYPLIISVRKSKPAQNHRVKVTVFNTTGDSRSFEVPQNELLLNKQNPKSPWLLAPPKVISAFRKIQSQSARLGDVYEINMGVMTSANDLYIIKRIIQCNNGLAQVELEGGDKVVVEAHLIHPMVRGESIHAFSYSIDFHIIFPHDTQSFAPLVDRGQWNLLNAIGVLGRSWKVDAKGKVLIYRTTCGEGGYNNVCTSIVNALLNNGLRRVAPCPTRIGCFDDQSSGLKINIDYQDGMCVVYVEGLRIPNANNATNHFLNNLEHLIKRDDYRINMPPWTIFRVSRDKFEEYRIAWREIAKHLEATHLPVQVQSPGGCLQEGRILVPIQTVYFVVEKDACKALLLLAYLNSDLARSLMRIIAAPARGGYFRHASYTVGHLPLPSGLHGLSHLCRNLNAVDLNKAGEQLVGKVNEELLRVLGISDDEYNELVDYARWLNEADQAVETATSPEEEEELVTQ